MQRAAHRDLKKIISERLKALREEAKLRGQGPPDPDQPLGERDLALFFSTWAFDAVRISTSIPSLDSIDALAAYLGLSRAQVSRVVEFLLQTGLCTRVEGRLAIGRRHLTLDSDSTLMDRHLLNWRAAAVDRVIRDQPGDFFLSMPMAVSASTRAHIRDRLREFVEALAPLARNTRSEELVCLNLDWFSPGAPV